jgi:hypothetical protein
MNNEPVAWIDPYDLERLPLNDCWVNGEKSKWADVPLYTHPAKTEDEGKVCARCGAIAYDPVITQTAKTLTDEEIQDLIVNKVTDADMIKQAIRKAQE